MSDAPECDPRRSRVTVAGCPSYAPGDVEAALDEALQAVGGLESFVKPGQTVLVKPNLFSPHPPEDAVTTHPAIVRRVAQLCVAAGAGRVWVGDSPVGTHPEAQLWARTGMDEAVAGAGARAELKSWRVRQTPLAAGEDVLSVPEWYRDVDIVISLPKLKAHCLTTLTCGVKNVYGIVTGQAKSQFHAKYPSPLTMGEFLVRVFAALKPQLTVADAVTAMEGNGPAHGRPLQVGVLLASRDAVALDAVACRPLRIAPAAVPMIRLAAAQGLGRMEDAEIECWGSGVSALREARMKPSLSRFLKHFPEWAFGAKLRPLSMLPKVRKKRCLKCGMCTEVCPRGAIAIREKNGYPTIDRADCIACFCCLESCPESSIAAQFYLGKFLCFGQQTRGKADKQ